MRAQCADLKKALSSAHKMNVGGDEVVSDGDRSYLRNNETGQKTTIKHEGGQYVLHIWAPSVEKNTPGSKSRFSRTTGSRSWRRRARSRLTARRSETHKFARRRSSSSGE
jgi:hypothetical protein